jgi:polyisoprenoid-binding protein YceI
MRRPVRILVAIGLVVAVAFVAVYLVFFNSDSPDKLTLTPVDERSSTTAGSGDVSGTWTVASGSTAGYRVREKLASLPAQSDAVGRTSDVTGTVVIAGTMVTKADLQVDVTTLKSDQDRRDSRIKSMGLETERFPTATFTLTAPIDIGDAKAATADVKATGDLTIHGVTKSVTIPLEAARNGDKLEIVGSLTFPMSDFDITPPSIGGFVTVEKDATLELKVLLERAS